MVNKDARCHAHWDVDEFHEVSDEAHDSEADGNCPADVQVFWESRRCQSQPTPGFSYTDLVV